MTDPSANEPVTEVVSRCVKPGSEAAYEAWLDRLIDGHLRCGVTVLAPDAVPRASSGALKRPKETPA